MTAAACRGYSLALSCRRALAGRDQQTTCLSLGALRDAAVSAQPHNQNVFAVELDPPRVISGQGLNNLEPHPIHGGLNTDEQPHFPTCVDGGPAWLTCPLSLCCLEAPWLSPLSGVTVSQASADGQATFCKQEPLASTGQDVARDEPRLRGALGPADVAAALRNPAGAAPVPGLGSTANTTRPDTTAAPRPSRARSLAPGSAKADPIHRITPVLARPLPPPRRRASP